MSQPDRAAPPDSPRPKRQLADYESYLPGFSFVAGHARVHLNWRLPAAKNYNVTVGNTLGSLTGQWLMRMKLRRSHWMVGGEKLGRRSPKHDRLTAHLRKASGIAAIGTWAERDYKERFPDRRVFNIPYHCSLDDFRSTPRAQNKNGAVTFLFCEQMIARKGLDHLLTAFAELPANARLLLIGREAELPRLLHSIPLGAASRARSADWDPEDGTERRVRALKEVAA